MFGLFSFLDNLMVEGIAKRAGQRLRARHPDAKEIPSSEILRWLEANTIEEEAIRDPDGTAERCYHALRGGDSRLCLLGPRQYAKLLAREAEEESFEQLNRVSQATALEIQDEFQRRLGPYYLVTVKRW